MLLKVWLSVAVTLLLGFIWVAGQGPVDPIEIQIQETNARNYQLVIEQQRRLNGWRQFYVNRIPYGIIVPLYLFVLYLARSSSSSSSSESCASLPAATSLGVYCCGAYTSSATCQASPQNAECTWDTSTCTYECTRFGASQALCTGVGCTWTAIGAAGFCS